MTQSLHEQALAWARTPKGCHVDGRWRTSGPAMDVIDPTTGQAVASVASADTALIDEAVAAARRAFVSARQSETRAARAGRLRAAGQIIRAHAAELAALISLENGKTYRESLDDDMPDTADVFDYYAGWIDKYYGQTAPVERGFLNYITPEPVGVCALIVPWNFPLLLAAWKLAPALAMGNSVLVKPSELTPLSLIRTVELWDEAGIFPPGLVNLVCGGGDVGDALARHPRIDKLSFTGSTATGQKIVGASGASNLKRVTLELGGKAPVILFADTPDLGQAIARCGHVAFSHKGEKCTEPTRLIVANALYDDVVAGLRAHVAPLVCGHPFDERARQGPQCGAAQFDKIRCYIDGGIASGATLLAGGAVAAGDGLWIPPVIFGDVDPTSALSREEIFGPVLVLQRFEREEEAIALANDSVYGLAAGIYTADLSRAHRVADAIDAGQVFVNRYGCYDFASPFGGFKQSGWGKEMGHHALEAYSRAKSVWIALGDSPA